MSRTQGSALLFVILTTGVTLMYFSFLWYRVMLVQEIAHQKEQYEHLFRLTDGALQVGISCGKKYLPLINGKQKQFVHNLPLEIRLHPWPPHHHANTFSIKNKKNYQAIVMLSRLESGDIQISSHLYTFDDGVLVRAISCMMKKNGTLQGWSVEA